MKKLLQFINNMLSSDKPESAKRTIGSIGMMVCFFIAFWCTLRVIQAPDYAYAILYACTALLGLDAAKEIFKKK